LSDTPTPDPVSHAVAVIDAAAEQAERLAPRRRRLIRALMDLDVLDAVGGREWVGIGEDGFEFAPLTSRQSDRLTNGLEDLVTLLDSRGLLDPEIVPVAPGQGELPLTW